MSWHGVRKLVGIMVPDIVAYLFVSSNMMPVVAAIEHGFGTMMLVYLLYGRDWAGRNRPAADAGEKNELFPETLPPTLPREALAVIPGRDRQMALEGRAHPLFVAEAALLGDLGDIAFRVFQ